MPIKTWFFPDEGVVYSRAVGRVSPGELMRNYEAAMARPDASIYRLGLHDLRHATDIGLFPEAMGALADAVTSDARRDNQFWIAAFVVGGQGCLGEIMTYAMRLNEGGAMRARVFQEFDEAVAWLGIAQDLAERVMGDLPE